MYHSVYFGDMNTFSDWHLVPDGRPVIVLPEPKKTVVDIPGGQGSLDLSEVLTNYPTYQNRSGSISFHVLNGYGEWQERYQEIANYLHGQMNTMILEDDPDYYYQGRFTATWTSPNDGTWSNVEIGYEVEPFKYSIDLETVPFTTVTDDVFELTLDISPLSMPIVPEFIIDPMNATSLAITLENPEIGLETDDYVETIGVEGDYWLYSLPISNMSGSNVCKFTITTDGEACGGILRYRRAVL